MNLENIIERLASNVDTFRSLIANVSIEHVHWKPSAEKWSMLEVINHLYDEEREDFRQRLQLVLSDPNTEWPSIAPQRWVIERSYSKRDMTKSFEAFVSERRQSIDWLRSLSAPNLELRHQREQGSLSAGDLLYSWLAHDFLHIRQLTRLHWQYLSAKALPFETTYAGPWQES